MASAPSFMAANPADTAALGLAMLGSLMRSVVIMKVFGAAARSRLRWAVIVIKISIPASSAAWASSGSSTYNCVSGRRSRLALNRSAMVGLGMASILVRVGGHYSPGPILSAPSHPAVLLSAHREAADPQAISPDLGRAGP